MMYGTRALYRYFQCQACSTLQLKSIPEDLAQFYPKQYYSLDPLRESGIKRRLINRLLGWREALALAGRSGAAIAGGCLRTPSHSLLALAALRQAGARRDTKILDVGCGQGTLIHRLRTAGYGGVEGCDPHVAATLRYANGLVVHKKTLGEMSGVWDLITFHHSLEHMPDPIEVLREARARLSPGGKVLVRVPTVSSQAWLDYGTNWVQLDAPRHLYLLSRAGLDLAAKAAGLRLLQRYDDSTSLQILGSRQYAMGVPLDDPRSVLRRPGALFSRRERRAAAARATQLNRQGQGDQLVAVYTAEA